MKPYFSILFTLFFSQLFSQSTIEKKPPNNIKTVILQEIDSEIQIPIIQLGKSLLLKFDDINGDEADYYYKINRYEFNWTTTSLRKQEYLNGMDDIHLQNIDNSYNTLQTFSHYQLTIPNENISITKSGNYTIEIYNDDGEFVFSKKFILYKKEANVAVNIKRAQEIIDIDHKQVVQFSITPNIDFFNNPKQTVKTLIFKNNNIDNAITNLKPQYTIGKKLIYKYDKEASFPGGNEFFYFDNKDIRGGNISIAHYELKELYHNHLYTNISRRHDYYTYNPDINGGFVTKNIAAENDDIEADYAQIHFSLENYENLGDRKIYVIGNFNNYILDEKSELTYNEKTSRYHNTSLIKQGFVNYKFITFTDNQVDHSLIDGDFYQTENTYTVLVYYRDIGRRYDQIIGIGSANSTNISN